MNFATEGLVVVTATQVQPKCEDCKGWRLLSHRQRNRLQEKTVQQYLILRVVSNIFSHFCLGGIKFKMTNVAKFGWLLQPISGELEDGLWHWVLTQYFSGGWKCGGTCGGTYAEGRARLSINEPGAPGCLNGWM